MFNFKSDLHRVATAMVDTLLLTTTFVGAAVGPARAIETAPAASVTAAPAGASINA